MLFTWLVCCLLDFKLEFQIEFENSGRQLLLLLFWPWMKPYMSKSELSTEIYTSLSKAEQAVRQKLNFPVLN